MQTILTILGWLTLAAGVVSGLIFGVILPTRGPSSFLVFILYALAGGISSVIWFALAEILRRQDETERRIDTVEYRVIRQLEGRG